MKLIQGAISLIALALLISCGSDAPSPENQSAPVAQDDESSQELPVQIKVTPDQPQSKDDFRLAREVELEQDFSNILEFEERINDYYLDVKNIPTRFLGMELTCLSKNDLGQVTDLFKTKISSKSVTLPILLGPSEIVKKSFECRYYGDLDSKILISFEILPSIVITSEKKLADLVGIKNKMVNLDTLILSGGTLYLEDKKFTLGLKNFIAKKDSAGKAARILTFPKIDEVAKDGENGAAGGTLVITAHKTFIDGLSAIMPGQKGGKQMGSVAKGISKGEAGTCSSYQSCFEAMIDIDNRPPDCLSGRCGGGPRHCSTHWTAPGNGGKGHQGATGQKGKSGGMGGALFIATSETLNIKNVAYNFEGGIGGEGGVGGEGGDGQPGGFCPATGRNGATGPKGDRGAIGPTGDSGLSGITQFKCFLASKNMNVCNQTKGTL